MHRDTLVLADLAELGLTARGRTTFRERVLWRLSSVLPHELAIFHTAPPVPPGVAPVVIGLSAQAERRLPSRWVAHAPAARDRPACAELLEPGEGARLFSLLTGEIHPGTAALLIPLERSGQPSSWLVLGRRGREFSDEELELARLLAPVLALGEAHALALPEAVGAELSAREAEIFEYLCRGFRNEDIAEALGTSPHTVRNQLVRLYRKVGVCTRSELVGLASSVVRRASH